VNGARAVRGELVMSGPIRDPSRDVAGDGSDEVSRASRAAPAGRHGASPPRRPPPWEERASQWLFLFLSPKLPRLNPPEPPAGLAPFELDTVRRRDGGVLSATFYPAAGEGSRGRGRRARGAVLLLHPWLKWGRAYFHRYGRIEALRAAGYHTLTVDFPGFGDSDPTDGTYFDRAVEDALVHLRTKCPGLPVHVWGVSSGGYWMHPVLSGRNGLGRNGLGRNGVQGAFFEDVSPHLLEWSWRMAPLGRPFYAAFRLLYGRGYRYLDLRDHAPHLRVRRLAYVSGALDPGVRPRDTRALAERAGAPHLLVPGADHLDSIKQAPKAVVELALRTFEGAE
jgi:pimeloyl-ACP methyl ester carboxylesterase